MTALDTRRVAERLAHYVPLEITADGIRLRDDLVSPPPVGARHD